MHGIRALACGHDNKSRTLFEEKRGCIAYTSIRRQAENIRDPREALSQISRVKADSVDGTGKDGRNGLTPSLTSSRLIETELSNDHAALEPTQNFAVVQSLFAQTASEEAKIIIYRKRSLKEDK